MKRSICLDWLEDEDITLDAWTPLHFDVPLLHWTRLAGGRPSHDGMPPLDERTQAAISTLIAPHRALPSLEGIEVQAAIWKLAGQLLSWRHEKSRREEVRRALVHLRFTWLAHAAGRFDLCRYQFEIAKSAWLRAAIAPAMSRFGDDLLVHDKRVRDGIRSSATKKKIQKARPDASIKAVIAVNLTVPSRKLAKLAGTSPSTVLRLKRTMKK